jgi:hypothetical protein
MPPYEPVPSNEPIRQSTIQFFNTALTTENQAEASGNQDTTSDNSTSAPLKKPTESESSEKAEHKEKSKHTPKPLGFVSQKPWLPIGALLTTLTCIIFAITVVRTADGTRAGTWKIAPQVLLAIASAVGNTALAYTYTRNLAASWWRKAHRGSTLAELHRHWLLGTDFFASFRSIYYLEPVAIGCVFATLAVIDGPLLQRSAHLVTEAVFTNKTVHLPVAKHLQQGYSGFRSPGSDGIPILRTPLFEADSYNFANKNFDPFKRICTGNCTFEITGIGLQQFCNESSSTEVTIVDPNINSTTYFAVHDLSIKWNPKNETPYNEGIYLNSFHAEVSARPINESLLNITRSIMIRNCSLVPSIITYSIDTSPDEPDFSTSADPDKVIKYTTPMNDSPATNDWTNSTWGGIYLSLQESLRGSIGFSFDSSRGFTRLDMTGNVGELTPRLANSVSTGTNKSDFDDPSPFDPSDMFTSPWNFTSPDPGLFYDTIINTLMFIVMTESGDDAPTDAVQLTQILWTGVYHPKYRFLVAAMTIMTTAWLIMGLSLLSWKNLGKRPSMNPLEVARIFNAPIMRTDVSGFEPLSVALKEIGTTEVRYGIVVRGEKEGEEDWNVLAEKKHQISEQTPGAGSEGTTTAIPPPPTRVGIARAGFVRLPVKEKK